VFLVVGIYDSTLCFRGEEPLFGTFLRGEPNVADFLIRKIPIAEVPTDEDECAKFVYDMYSEKVCSLLFYHHLLVMHMCLQPCSDKLHSERPYIKDM